LKLIKKPNTRLIMILSIFVESIQSYRENPSVAVGGKRACPECKTRFLSRHGTYSRWVYFSDRRETVVIQRLRCRPCRLTVSLLPDVLAPYRRYTLNLIESALDAVLEGASYRTTAVALSGAVLPSDASITDALTWTSIKPSHQRVYAWLKQLTDTASDNVAVAAEWLVRRVPGGIGADLVTAPLEPKPCRSLQAEKRAAFLATRLLARLFRDDPNLNPLSNGWLRAWQHFVARILLRSPWRRPPRPPPEPHCS
jgi:hypothetical protein